MHPCDSKTASYGSMIRLTKVLVNMPIGLLPYVGLVLDDQLTWNVWARSPGSLDACTTQNCTSFQA